MFFATEGKVVRTKHFAAMQQRHRRTFIFGKGEIVEKEPAVWISLLGAFLVLLSVFGVALTEGKIQAIMGLATVAVPLVIGIITRRNVYSPASAQTLLNMPQGVSMTMANRALAADVKVKPGDTKAEVIEKVNAAEAKE
jgi:hypothetical protein